MSSFGGAAVDLEIIDEVSKLVSPGDTIVELGSGHGSTSELCKTYDLYSVEHDPKFVGLYESTYIHAPLVNDFWYDREIVKAGLPEQYSLLLVDGPIGFRREGLLVNYDLFDPSVPIILDDTQRDVEQRMIKMLVDTFNKTLVKDIETSTGKKYAVLLPN